MSAIKMLFFSCLAIQLHLPYTESVIISITMQAIILSPLHARSFEKESPILVSVLIVISFRLHFFFLRNQVAV